MNKKESTIPNTEHWFGLTELKKLKLLTSKRSNTLLFVRCNNSIQLWFTIFVLGFKFFV